MDSATAYHYNQIIAWLDGDQDFSEFPTHSLQRIIDAPYEQEYHYDVLALAYEAVQSESLNPPEWLHGPF